MPILIPDDPVALVHLPSDIIGQLRIGDVIAFVDVHIAAIARHVIADDHLHLPVRPVELHRADKIGVGCILAYSDMLAHSSDRFHLFADTRIAI